MPRKKFYIYHHHLGSESEVIVGATSEVEAINKAQDAGLSFHRCPHCGDTFWYLWLAFATLKGAREWADEDAKYVR